MTLSYWRFIPLLVVSIVLLACSKAPDTDRGPGPEEGTDLPLVGTDQMLVDSIERLAGGVNSGRAQFSWKVESDSFKVQGSGEYAVQSSGNLELDAHYKGQGSKPSKFSEANDSYVLVLADRVYVKSPPLGRDAIQLTPQEFGADWGVVQRLIAGHSPIQYQGIVAGATQTVQKASTDRISGNDYVHLTTSVDAGTVMNAMADAYGSQGQIMLANRFAGQVQLDVWLDPETLLPLKVRAVGDIPLYGETGRLEVTVEYSDFNAVNTFAAAPQGAKKLSELAR